MASELDYSTTPGSNVSINGVGIAGTDLPSNLDNAMREIAANRANAQPRAILKTANYAATKDDFGKTFVFSGAFQLTIPTIATLATGWNIYAEAAAASPLTIVRSGSNTINGATSITILPGKRCRVFVSQSATDLKADIQLTALSANAALLLADTNVPRLGTVNAWTQINTFPVVQSNMPADFWSASSSYYNVGTGAGPSGGLSHESSNGVYVTSNGYRNAAGSWTSYAIAGNTGASQIELLPTGIINFNADAIKANGSAIRPTTRMTMLADGKVGIGTTNPLTEFYVVGTATATTFAGSGASLTNLNASALATGTVPSARMNGSYSFDGLSLSQQLVITATVPYMRLTETVGGGIGQFSMGNGYLLGTNTTGNYRFAGADNASDLSSFAVRSGGAYREVWHAGNLVPGALATKSTINDSDWSGADLAIANGGTGASTAAAAVTALGAVPTTRTISTGTGLQGDGNLASNRTISLAFGSLTFKNSGVSAPRVVCVDGASNGTEFRTDGAGFRSLFGFGPLSSASGLAPAGNIELAGFDASGALATMTAPTNSLAKQSTVNNDDWFGTDLSIGNGGTGASTATDAMIAFINGAVPVAPGGSIRILCQTAAGVPSTALINTSTGAISGITAL